MNIQRYIMPVAIAAGLHTAILFCSTDTTRPPRTPKEDPPVLRPMPRIEMTDPATEIADPGTGKADPLPTQEDIPRPVTVEDIFTIQVKPAAESIKPVLALPENPSASIGPGDGPFDFSGSRRVIESVGHLDRAPRATVQTPPPYPSTMSSSSISGSVTVEFVVDTTGRVITAEGVRWTHREFVDPAVRAVLHWRFEPGTVQGRKVNFRMAVPIQFNAER